MKYEKKDVNDFVKSQVVIIDTRLNFYSAHYSAVVKSGMLIEIRGRKRLQGFLLILIPSLCDAVIHSLHHN